MSEERYVVYYPVCGEWTCDDFDYDWETVDKETVPEVYRAARREEQIARYHQPRADWRRRLQQERDEKNNGDPLWVGK